MSLTKLILCHNLDNYISSSNVLLSLKIIVIATDQVPTIAAALVSKANVIIFFVSPLSLFLYIVYQKNERKSNSLIFLFFSFNQDFISFNIIIVKRLIRSEFFDVETYNSCLYTSISRIWKYEFVSNW